MNNSKMVASVAAVAVVVGLAYFYFTSLSTAACTTKPTGTAWVTIEINPPTANVLNIDALHCVVTEDQYVKWNMNLADPVRIEFTPNPSDPSSMAKSPDENFALILDTTGSNNKDRNASIRIGPGPEGKNCEAFYYRVGVKGTVSPNPSIIIKPNGATSECTVPDVNL